MRAFRISPLLFRRIHKWVGLILGLQFVLWTVSGAMMAVIDHHAVSGEHLGHPPEPAAWPARALSPADIRSRLGGVEVTGLTLRPMLRTYVYEVATPDGTRMVNAVTGEPLTINAELAKSIAVADYAGNASVSRVSRQAEPTLETRDHDEPLWRVDFADEGETSFYLSEANGRILQRRDENYRLWDFFWMLHNMDYAERKSFNHPLIIMVAFGILWLSSTGFYLLFKSFRRSDFRWVPGVLPRESSSRMPAE